MRRAHASWRRTSDTGPDDRPPAALTVVAAARGVAAERAFSTPHASNGEPAAEVPLQGGDGDEGEARPHDREYERAEVDRVEPVGQVVDAHDEAQGGGRAHAGVADDDPPRAPTALPRHQVQGGGQHAEDEGKAQASGEEIVPALVGGGLALLRASDPGQLGLYRPRRGFCLPGRGVPSSGKALRGVVSALGLAVAARQFGLSLSPRRAFVWCTR